MQKKISKNFNNPWRQIAATIYHKPKDGRISGTVELDVTGLETFIQEQRSQGIKVTYTHFFLAAVARAIHQVAPEFNTYVARGNIIHRDSIDGSLSVLIDQDTQMSSILIKEVDKKTLTEIVAVVNRELGQVKHGLETNHRRGKSLANAIPWPWRGWLVNCLRVLTMEWGFSFPALGINPHLFGSFLLTNIGTVGLDIGYPALMPFSSVSAVLALGKVSTQPRVVDNKIVPRKVLQISASIDHRVVDAQHIGLLFKFLKVAVKNPQQFLS